MKILGARKAELVLRSQPEGHPIVEDIVAPGGIKAYDLISEVLSQN